MRYHLVRILLVATVLQLLAAAFCFIGGPSWNPARTTDLPSLIRVPQRGVSGANWFVFKWWGGVGVVWTRGWYSRRFAPQSGPELTRDEENNLRERARDWGADDSLRILHYYTAPTSAEFVVGWPVAWLYVCNRNHDARAADPVELWNAAKARQPNELYQTMTVAGRRLGWCWFAWIAMLSPVWWGSMVLFRRLRHNMHAL